MANSTYPIPLGRAGSGTASRQIKYYERGTAAYTLAMEEDWRCDFDITLAGALDADTSQEFDLHTYLGSNPQKGVLFPANVVRCSPCKVFVETQAVGATTCTVQVGDTGDPNGLFTATNCHTGEGTWLASTPAAAEYTRRIEAAYIPVIQIDTTGANISALTALKLTILIPFIKLPLVS